MMFRSYTNECKYNLTDLTGWDDRIGKNCDRGLENAVRGRRPSCRKLQFTGHKKIEHANE